MRWFDKLLGRKKSGLEARVDASTFDVSTPSGRLKQMLSQASQPLAELEEFFDGNNDLGSIGCNLIEHPGIEVFRRTFFELSRRDDVDRILFQIADLDTGEDSWPFCDTVWVLGSISGPQLHQAVSHLLPDEVAEVDHAQWPPIHGDTNFERGHSLWWD